MDRRTFLLAIPTLGCRRPLSVGFDVFVANHDGRSVAAVDLTTFRVRKEVGIDGNPAGIVSHGQHPAIYVLIPETGTVHELDPLSLSVRRKSRVAPSAISMRMATDGNPLWILSGEARALVQLNLAGL